MDLEHRIAASVDNRHTSGPQRNAQGLAQIVVAGHCHRCGPAALDAVEGIETAGGAAEVGASAGITVHRRHGSPMPQIYQGADLLQGANADPVVVGAAGRRP